MRPKGAARRGQATLELALGLLVFITVLAFGIHFAEVAYLSIRVQHAAAFAVYDATGQRTHVGAYKLKEKGLVDSVPGMVSMEAVGKFRDFEANTGKTNEVKPIRHVFTDIEDMALSCTKEDSLSFRTDPPSLPLGVGNPFDGSLGGIKCFARATVSLGKAFPQSYFDDDWGRREEHYSGKHGAYTVCATPRSKKGQCGQFGLLVADFSLQGKGESASHDLQSGGNSAFAEVVEKAGEPYLCAAAVNLSVTITGSASPGACDFAMSYKGVEADYRQNIGGVHAGETTWLTGGVDSRRKLSFPHTFLGVDRD